MDRFSFPYFLFPLSPQDGNIYLYSVQGNTLKATEKLALTGPVIELAYSNDGAYLAVIDEKKLATVFTVADNYSVNICYCSYVRFYPEMW